jgi:hypothetical protein
MLRSYPTLRINTCALAGEIILYDSELLLVGKTFLSDGRIGCDMTNPGAVEILNRAIDQMGNTENHKVLAVNLY